MGVSAPSLHRDSTDSLIYSPHIVAGCKNRAIVVELELPTVAPELDYEQDAFAELKDLLSSGTTSSTIGWAIKVGENLDEKREEIGSFVEKLKGIFSSRHCKNWGILLFFLGKVSASVSTNMCMYCTSLY